MSAGEYPPTRWSRPLLATLAIVGALGVAASFAYLGVAWNVDDDPWEPVASVEELIRRNALYLPEQGVWLVSVPEGAESVTAPADARSRGVMALVNDAQHIPGEGVRWCDSAEVFESPMHGEKFDRFGAYLDGPALKGLDRVAVRVREGEVEIDLSVVTPGPERGEVGVRDPAGPFCQNL